MEDLSRAGKGLVMTMGKGGVGKTTVAAAVAVSLARRGHKSPPDHLRSGSHLSYTLDGSLPGLQVSRIDPKQRLSAIVALCWKSGKRSG